MTSIDKEIESQVKVCCISECKWKKLKLIFCQSAEEQHIEGLAPKKCKWTTARRRMVKSENRGIYFQFREEFMWCRGESVGGPRESEIWKNNMEKIEVPLDRPCIKTLICVCLLPLQSWLSQTECLCPQQKPFWLVSIQDLDSCMRNEDGGRGPETQAILIKICRKSMQ